MGTSKEEKGTPKTNSSSIAPPAAGGSLPFLAQINAKRDDKFVVDGSNKSYTTRNEDTPEPLSEISSKQTPDTKPVSLSNATSNTGKSSSAGKHHMSFNPFSHHKSRKIRHQLPHQFHKMCHRYHQVVHLMHLLRILSRTHHQCTTTPPPPSVPSVVPRPHRQQYQIPYLQHYQLQNLVKITHLQCQRTYQATTHLRHRLCHQVLHPHHPEPKSCTPPPPPTQTTGSEYKSSSSTSRVSSSNFNDLDLRQNAGTNLRKISALAYTINPRNASNGDSKPEKLVIDDKRFKFVNANITQEDLVREVKRRVVPKW